ncbi:TonB-dependent receptor domain-containing protein [Chitinophaga flava]|uniref:TonB-dependent receptor n=1 Tax=Chitinophaga flava TaxID=2259036 RepID=A0A365XP81_9BACT|nr:TonB-dependent receptor [Chitinophaga flava]RBL88153.1 TonB-dependent receptor [Chitinophaga flava]
MKRILFFLLLLSVGVQARQVQPAKASTYPGIVTGRIADSSSGKSIPFATVVVKNDSAKVVAGAMTTEKGTFEITEVPAGNFTLEVQYIGYSHFSKRITITTEKPHLQAGILQLAANATTLKEQVVEGQAYDVAIKLDRKIYTMGKDLLSQSGSAKDILDNIPSVTVDAKGKVSLRGNSQVNVLINGKTSGLTLGNALDQIPADNIDKVEVITSPSARYEADGSAGIINIILKKNKKNGLNGQARLTGGIPADYRANVSLNYKAGKFNLFSTLGYRYTNYIGEYGSDQEITNPANNSKRIMHFSQNEKRHDDGKLLYVGADYFIDSKNSITAAFFRNGTTDSDEDKLNYNYGAPGMKDSSIFRRGDSKEWRNYSQLEFNYTRTFNKEGRKLTVDMQYDFWNSDKRWDLQTQKIYPDTVTLPAIRTSSIGASKDFLLKSDYVSPLSKQSSMEAGIQLENRLVTSDYKAEQLQGSEWSIYNGLNNVLDYKEQIGAAYVQFQSKIQQFSYQLGLRDEYTLVKIDDRKGEFSNRKEYNRLFPTANLSYHFKTGTTLQLNYSKRISRPSLEFIYPFNELTNYNSQYLGNPELNPAYTDAFNLDLLHRWRKVSLNPSLYYQHTKDFILFYTYLDQDQNMFMTIPINLKGENRYGTTISVTYDPVKTLNFGGEFNVYGFDQAGVYQGRDFDHSDFSWSIRLNGRWKLPYKFNLQGRFNLIGEQNNAQTRTESYNYVDLGLGKNLLKDKMTIVFDVSNVFDTRIIRKETKTQNYIFRQHMNSNAARYRLSIAYRFNKASQNERREKETNRR